MISRAIIESKIDINHFRVRVPTLNKSNSSIGSTPTNELAIATVCAIPGYNPSFNIGDTIFVEFEENDFSRPVILGKIYNETHSKSSASDGNLDSIKVNVNAQLPSDTSIGSIKRNEIEQLKGLTTNIQIRFDQINSELTNILNKVYELASSNNYSEVIKELQDINKKQNNVINTIKNNISNIQSELDGALVLNKINYGTADPSTISNSEEGQIYIYIQ